MAEQEITYNDIRHFVAYCYYWDNDLNEQYSNFQDFLNSEDYKQTVIGYYIEIFSDGSGNITDIGDNNILGFDMIGRQYPDTGYEKSLSYYIERMKNGLNPFTEDQEG